MRAVLRIPMADTECGCTFGAEGALGGAIRERIILGLEIADRKCYTTR